ncbi:amino acid ABC transporter permease [Anaerosporobacter faecicola]|uniref:amino acid ABC transporter permease n=1 Tax=Anaerosporobacter faecicola TaxID=2718714 RepID=UPI0014393866|nr:amino acid ABC transporter permease [Anaerosporobacter faecicola]
MWQSAIDVLFQGRNAIRLLEGLWVTIRIALISIALSILLGMLFGFLMKSERRLVRFLCKIYLEFIRIMPQLVLLFLVYFGLARTLQLNLSGESASILVFTLWGTAEMGDLFRGALESIPKHQYESGMALGFTNRQLYVQVILPQTIRRLLPQAMNLVTRMIKTTSLVVLIGVVEVVKVGQQIIEATRLTTPGTALVVYSVIFFLYFMICYPITRIAKRLEQSVEGGS